MRYKYTPAEVADMKALITFNCENEEVPDARGHFSAWRLRAVLAGLANITTEKRARARAWRRLALYERLTREDLPAW